MDNISRIPISSVAQLSQLDDKEMVEGYYDGFAGEPEPGGNRPTSYWHGWRNGARDKGFIPGDDAMTRLAHEVIATGYLTKGQSNG